MRLTIVLFALLAACSRQPLSPERQEAIDQVSAASLLGNELVVDVGPKKVLGSSRATYDVASWSVDAAFRDLFKAGVEARGKRFVAFEVSQKDLEKTAGVRESRWKKILGRQSQAMLDLLFDSADRQNIRYFFLLTPPLAHDRFAVHYGNFGAACDDAGSPDGRATAYFFFDFALWDVQARKKVFESTVDPSMTAAMTFGDCKVIAGLADPAKQLEDPVKKTMGLVVDNLFDKMGWGRPANPVGK